MLSPTTIEEIRRRLAHGEQSQRQLARELGVSRGTISAIASGRRPDYTLKSSTNPSAPQQLAPSRCRRCGGMVYAPCRVCQIRNTKAREQIIAMLRGQKRYRATG